MKNKYLLLLISTLCLLSFSSIAQDFWEVVPTPDTIDIKTMAIHPNGDLLLGTSRQGDYRGGVYLSQNDGETWEFIGLNINSIYSLFVDSLGNFFAGSSMKIYKSSNYGESWDLVYTGADNILCFASGDDGLIFAGSAVEVGILRSFDYGENWDTVFWVPGWNEYVTDIDVSTDGTVSAGSTAWQGNGGGVYQSSDDGNTWEHIGLFEEGIQTIEYNSSNILYAGSIGPNWGVYQKSLVSNDWNQIFGNGTVKGIVTNIYDWIYIGCSNEFFPGGAYYTNDLGNQWIPISSGLISNDIDEMYISSDQYLYNISGSTNTLYKSFQSTVSIEKYSNNINLAIYPNPFINFIMFDLVEVYNDNMYINIYNTQGRLVWDHNSNSEPHSTKIMIYTSDWNPGLYYYEIRCCEILLSGKVIKIR